MAQFQIQLKFHSPSLWFTLMEQHKCFGFLGPFTRPQNIFSFVPPLEPSLWQSQTTHPLQESHWAILMMRTQGSHGVSWQVSWLEMLYLEITETQSAATAVLATHQPLCWETCGRGNHRELGEMKQPREVRGTIFSFIYCYSGFNIPVHTDNGKWPLYNFNSNLLCHHLYTSSFSIKNAFLSREWLSRKRNFF